MHTIKRLFNVKIIELNYVAWVFSMHGVSCMNSNTRKVICSIDEWENEDSIMLDTTHLCKIYLCYSKIVLMRFKCVILTLQEA